MQVSLVKSFGGEKNQVNISAIISSRSYFSVGLGCVNQELS